MSIIKVGRRLKQGIPILLRIEPADTRLFVIRSPAEGPVCKVEQALGWIACRRDKSFRSLGQIDLRPPTFFGHSYKKDFVERSPLATLSSALHSERVHAYVHGTVLTPGESLSLLSDEDRLWGKKELVFAPHEIRDIWKRLAGSSSKTSTGAKGRALAELTAILIGAKSQKIRH